MMGSFAALLVQDLRLHIKRKTEQSTLLLFFIIVIILMPFALGPDPDILRRLAPGLMWLAVLLMSLLSFDHLFIQDVRDGTLDEMLISPMPLELIVSAKMAAQIIALLTTLLVMVLPAAFFLNMDIKTLPLLVLTLVLGIPSIVLLGGIVGSITVALTRNAALLTLLLIPFYIPILIFAVATCEAGSSGISVEQPLLFLSAILALILPTAPFIIAASLRQGQG
jgi:heme exporter protein B